MKNGTFKRILTLTLVALMLLTAVFATGCAKKEEEKEAVEEITIESIKKKAEDAGYEVYVIDETDLAGANLALVAAKIDGRLNAAIEVFDETSLWAEIYEFDKASAAMDFVDNYDEIAGELAENEVIRRVDKYVITGSEAIVEEIW